MKKKNLTPEQLYKKNKKRLKTFKVLSPIIHFGFLILGLIFLFFMIKNSVGNITEIIDLLDKKKHSEEMLQKNYQYLVNKWGEWVILGDLNGSITIRFVDIRNALFSKLMVTNLILGIVCLSISLIIGKLLLSKLIKYYSENNQDIVNIATLQTHASITNKEKKKEDWF